LAYISRVLILQFPPSAFLKSCGTTTRKQQQQQQKSFRGVGREWLERWIGKEGGREGGREGEAFQSLRLMAVNILRVLLLDPPTRNEGEEGGKVQGEDGVEEEDEKGGEDEFEEWAIGLLVGLAHAFPENDAACAAAILVLEEMIIRRPSFYLPLIASNFPLSSPSFPPSLSNMARRQSEAKEEGGVAVVVAAAPAIGEKTISATATSTTTSKSSSSSSSKNDRSSTTNTCDSNYYRRMQPLFLRFLGCEAGITFLKKSGWLNKMMLPQEEGGKGGMGGWALVTPGEGEGGGGGEGISRRGKGKGRFIDMLHECSGSSCGQ